MATYYLRNVAHNQYAGVVAFNNGAPALGNGYMHNDPSETFSVVKVNNIGEHSIKLGNYRVIPELANGNANVVLDDQNENGDMTWTMVSVGRLFPSSYWIMRTDDAGNQLFWTLQAGGAMITLANHAGAALAQTQYWVLEASSISG